MDLEGYGLGGGILLSFLAAIGINRRVDKLEDNVVYKDVCTKCAQDTEHRFQTIKEGQEANGRKLDTILEKLK